MMPNRAIINLAYLSLGSNIEPENNLTQAVALLSQFGKVKATSSVWPQRIAPAVQGLEFDAGLG